MPSAASADPSGQNHRSWGVVSSGASHDVGRLGRTAAQEREAGSVLQDAGVVHEVRAAAGAGHDGVLHEPQDATVGEAHGALVVGADEPVDAAVERPRQRGGVTTGPPASAGPDRRPAGGGGPLAGVAGTCGGSRGRGDRPTTATARRRQRTTVTARDGGRRRRTRAEPTVHGDVLSPAGVAGPSAGGSAGVR